MQPIPSTHAYDLFKGLSFFYRAALKCSDCEAGIEKEYPKNSTVGIVGVDLVEQSFRDGWRFQNGRPYCPKHARPEVYVKPEFVTTLMLQEEKELAKERRTQDGDIQLALKTRIETKAPVKAMHYKVVTNHRWPDSETGVQECPRCGLFRKKIGSSWYFKTAAQQHFDLFKPLCSNQYLHRKPAKRLTQTV